MLEADKNKNKGAQAKFAETNNAYEILSDEDKRENYDMYGDEKGHPGFEGSHPGGQGGYTLLAVDQDKTSLTSDLVNGRIWVGRSIGHIGPRNMLACVLRRRCILEPADPEAHGHVEVDDFIHADMHPGNILVRVKNKKLSGERFFKSRPHVIFLDVGMTAELSKQDRVNLIEFFKAVALRDGRTAAEHA